MPTVHLVEGPVGAGKSTLATRLSHEHRAPHLDLDQWMVALFRPDRPAEGFMEWYADRKQRCLDQIWHVAVGLLDLGDDVVLELGLVQRSLRLGFLERVRLDGYEPRVYLVDAPVDVRRERVRARNRAADGTFKMEVSDEIFAIANAAWEPPDEAEIRDWNVEFQ